MTEVRKDFTLTTLPDIVGRENGGIEKLPKMWLCQWKIFQQFPWKIFNFIILSSTQLPLIIYYGKWLSTQKTFPSSRTSNTACSRLDLFNYRSIQKASFQTIFTFPVSLTRLELTQRHLPYIQHKASEPRMPHRCPLNSTDKCIRLISNFEKI